MDTCLSLSAGAGNYAAVQLILESSCCTQGEEVREEKLKTRSGVGPVAGVGLDREEGRRGKEEEKGEEKGIRSSQTCCCHHTPYHLSHHRNFRGGHKCTRNANPVTGDDTAHEPSTLKGKLSDSKQPQTQQDSTHQNNTSTAKEVNILGILRNIENSSLKRSVIAHGRFSQLCAVDCCATLDESETPTDDKVGDVSNVARTSSGRPSPSATSSGSTVLVNILDLMRYVPYVTQIL